MSEPEKPKPERIGIVCAGCGCSKLRVVYTRRRRGAVLLRRRECVGCKTRITTWEKRIGIPPEAP